MKTKDITIISILTAMSVVIGIIESICAMNNV